MKTTNDLAALRPEVRGPVERVIAAMPVRMCVVATYRDPWEQARLFRRSRTNDEVHDRMQRLSAAGYPWLAKILEEVGPQPAGPKATGAGPGESWHQWGYAADLCPYVGKRLAWEPKKDDPDYAEAQDLWAAYAEAVRDAGLVQLSWEQPHVQVHAANSNPLEILSRDEAQVWREAHGW